MDYLTEEDEGVFLVRTQGSTHLWRIYDGHVTVERFSLRRNPFGCDGISQYEATVQAWPVVGACFLNIINGGGGDIPWTRSSTIKSIEQIGF